MIPNLKMTIIQLVMEMKKTCGSI